MQDNTVEIHYTPPPQQPYTPPESKLPKKAVVIIFAIVATLIIGAGVGFFAALRTSIDREVVGVLNTVPNAMGEAAQDRAAYPQKIPTGLSTNEVALSGGGSFDGTAYCVTGVSTAQASVVYHIDSSTQQPVRGACPGVASRPTPGAVQGLATTAVGSTNIGLGWQATDNATGYTLQCSIDATFKGALIETVSTQTQGVCSNLDSQTTYYVRIQAKGQTAAGPWSEVVKGTTALLSIAPENLTLRPTSTTQVEYSWSPVVGATSYIIERATDTSFTKDLVTLTQTKTTGVSTDLKPGTHYYYHVKATTASFNATQAAFSNVVGTITDL